MLDPIIKDRLELVLAHSAKIRRRITNLAEAAFSLLYEEVGHR